jgi:hypothetical protein
LRASNLATFTRVCTAIRYDLVLKLPFLTHEL